jgi:DNA end-binding protein Ku
LLRYPYEVRNVAEYFDDIQDVKITKDMLELAKHIVESKAGHFKPAGFKDHYEGALQELLEKKQKGHPIVAAKKAAPGNVYSLMDALKASIKGHKPLASEKARRQRKPSRPSVRLADRRHASDPPG